MSPQDRRTLRIGLVGFVVAVLLILGAWRIVASDLPDFRAAAALPGPTPTSEPTGSRTPSETFVVPSPPPPVTPTVTESPASVAPEPVDEPSEPATPTVAVPAPPAARGVTPPRTEPAAPSSQVSGIDLSCNQTGQRIAATLTFVSSGPVPVSLTAGARSETSRGSGAVRMRVSGPGGEGASCTAVVDGRQIGPVPGGGRR